jgi:adenylosuccinate lyase
MIDRYSLPAMRNLWSEETKFQTWLDVELAVCDAWAKRGKIPKADLKRLHQKSKFSIRRINQIESKVKHDVIAFVSAVAENVGPSGRYLHLGMTSSDLVDTALAIRLRTALQLISTELEKTKNILIKKAKRYKYTLMIGRTHGIHAEPITFGLKLGLWVNEMERNSKRIDRAIETINVGKISGAVGTYAYITPDIEKQVCKSLELKPAEISNQIIQRDRHAEVLTALAILGGTIEKVCTEIRHLQRTEVLEAEEPFTEGQKGSSAMPHKRNPVTCEQLCGLARVVRTNALAGIENIALWHERDISHSSVERIILPDSTTLIHYMLNKLNDVLSNLIVYEKNMKENIHRTHGLIFSQQVLLALTQKGLAREQAYTIVQENAMKAWRDKISLQELLIKDERIEKVLKPQELKKCFNPDVFTRHVDTIFKRQEWYHDH